MISKPTVRAGGLVLVVPRMEVLGPYIRAVVPPDVCRARTVLEASEPRVMEEPGFKVWLEIMYWDWAFGVMVWSLMVISAGAFISAFISADVVGKISAEVIRILEPAALSVSRTIAGRWIEEGIMSPWAVSGTGTVGIVATGDGEGVMMLFDAGAAWLKILGSSLFADTMMSGALWTESSEGAVVVVGAIPASGERK